MTKSSKKTDLDFNINEDHMRLQVDQLNYTLEKISLGGGKQNAEKQKQQGKMLARERIDYLLDKSSERIEIGAFAALDMYEEFGGCPAAGVVVMMGYVEGRQCLVVANDATVKAGAWFPMTCKKNLRAQEIALENRLPIIYLVDSAGVFLPLQDEVFPDKENFGRIFRNNARLSSMGIIQVAAIMGSCVAGGAYLPIMSDEALIVDKTGSIFLAGSYLVKAAIGEEIDNETLGGSITHSEISGVTDNRFPNDQAALDYIRNIFRKSGSYQKEGFNRIKPQSPRLKEKELYGIVPKKGSRQYDMHEIIYRLTDNSEFEEYKPDYGQTLVCGLARIDGWSIGIVANQRKVVKTRKGEMQFGGVIYSDSADKAARFVMNCNQRKIPLLFLQDVTGFMVGSKSEHGGIIKDGAKLVNAQANSIVPKFTVIIGNSFGAGNYAMCGKAYDPRLIVTWPSAQLAVMGASQAAETLLQIQKNTLTKSGKQITEEEETKLFENISSKYNNAMTPYHAASKLWVDAVIDPLHTRKWISLGISAANHSPITAAYNTGVLQT